MLKITLLFFRIYFNELLGHICIQLPSFLHVTQVLKQDRSSKTDQTNEPMLSKANAIIIPSLHLYL